MNIKSAIEAEHSKAQMLKIVAYIGTNEDRFEELMTCFFSSDARVCQRAAYPLGNIGVDHPFLVQPYLSKMVALLSKDVHNAAKRNTLRILQHLEVPEELMGEAVEKCFEFLTDPKAAVALRAFSMTILYNITLREPDLAEELKLTIETYIDHSTSGFKSRGMKILKLLDKVIKK